MKTTIKLQISSFTNNCFKGFIFCLIVLLPNIYASAQTQLAVGASLGVAPTFGYEGRNVSGTVASIFGDLTLKNNLIGRAAFTTVLEGGNDSRFAANGSVGYNITIGESKLEIPVMATLGYVGMFYQVLSNRFYDASMQIGGTVSPQYFVTDRLAINLTARLLKGTSVNGGGNIDITDISVGVKFALFNGE